MAYVTVTLLSDEAIGVFIRRLVETGYSVSAGFGENNIVAGPKGEWCGRVILLRIDKSSLNNQPAEAIAKDVMKSAERINYLSATVMNGQTLYVCGPHLVDSKEKEKIPGEKTAYDTVGDDK